MRTLQTGKGLEVVGIAKNKGISNRF